MKPAGGPVGFSSQRIRYDWLVRTSQMCLAGVQASEIEKELYETLSPALSHTARSGRGSCQKAITILRKVWVSPRPELLPLRNEGMRLLAALDKSDQKALHWGMVMAAYPFWAAVAAETGRLLRLQESVTAGQVRRRIIEVFGDRELIARATRNVLRSFVDWSVLRETSRKGVYGQGEYLTLDNIRLIAWLVEALLHAYRVRAVPVAALLDSTSLFPFRLRSVPAPQLVAASERLDLVTQGLTEDLVVLASPPPPPSAHPD